MNPEKFHETNPVIVEAGLRQNISRLCSFSEGWLKGWFARFQELPLPARQRLWRELKRQLSKGSMENIRKWYDENYPHRKVKVK